MAVEQLDHINIRCKNIDRVKAFYVTLLGLSEGPRPQFESSGSWLYSAGAREPLVHLVEIPAEGAAPVRGGALDHVAFRCTDLAAMRGVLQTAAIPFRETEIPGVRVPQLFFHDPEGTGVELNFPLAQA